MMNFKEMLSKYKLGFLPFDALPEIAILAMEEGYESESLFILAGLNYNNGSFEVEEYFRKALIEMNMSLPSGKNAFNIILNYHLLGILGGKIAFEEGMNYFINEIVGVCDQCFGCDINHAPEKAGIKILESMYRYYSDLEDDIAGGYFYKKGVTVEELKQKYKNDILEEIKVVLKKLNNGTLN